MPPQFAISTFRGKIWNLGPHPGNGSARSQLPFFFKPSRFLCCEIPYILPVVEYFTSGIFRKFENGRVGEFGKSANYVIGFEFLHFGMLEYPHSFSGSRTLMRPFAFSSSPNIRSFMRNSSLSVKDIRDQAISESISN